MSTGHDADKYREAEGQQKELTSNRHLAQNQDYYNSARTKTHLAYRNAGKTVDKSNRVKNQALGA